MNVLIAELEGIDSGSGMFGQGTLQFASLNAGMLASVLHSHVVGNNESVEQWSETTSAIARALACIRAEQSASSCIGVASIPPVAGFNAGGTQTFTSRVRPRRNPLPPPHVQRHT